MPELPEVESVRRGLEKAILGYRISGIELFHPRALNPRSEYPIESCVGKRIQKVSRRGKFLWMTTESNLALVAHLGMSGQFLIKATSEVVEKHLRARILFTTAGDDLRFIDQRTFGWLGVSEIEDNVPVLVTHIARDIFDPDFDEVATIAAMRKKRSEIKRVLLDQTIVSGIGNIYADESLWRAKLHPSISAQSLTPAKIRNLLHHVRQVMEEALLAGGTSFDDLYIHVNGESGYFDRALNVYGRAGQACFRCGGQVIRIAFAGRGSHLCPQCQPGAK